VVIEMEKEVALALLGFLIATGMTLWLYQIDFQGLGHLTNWSKTAGYCLEGTKLFTNGTLFLQISRVDGPDTYGGFIVLVQVLYPNGTVVYQWNANQLGHIPKSDIHNEFSLHPAHSTGFALCVPLGQNATVILNMPFSISPGTYIVKVYDADGASAAYGQEWEIEVQAES
jgi:thiosulfate dehydrogenase [quinone] small subunit